MNESTRRKRQHPDTYGTSACPDACVRGARASTTSTTGGRGYSWGKQPAVGADVRFISREPIATGAKRRPSDKDLFHADGSRRIPQKTRIGVRATFPRIVGRLNWRALSDAVPATYRHPRHLRPEPRQA